jgi:cyanophycinase
MSAHMIARGAEGATPRAGLVTLAPGLGLSPRLIIDQHFRQRERLGRLLTAVAYNPWCFGLGVDEDTAAFLAPDGGMTVRGAGGVTVVDPTDVTYSSIAEAEAGEPVSMHGVRVHVLVEGDRYHFGTRVATGHG